MWPRRHSTSINGVGFTEATRRAVWNTAAIAPGYNSAFVRQDVCGNLIEYVQYGNTNHAAGWEIDHKLPVARGGTDILSNLQALQWETNRHKSDTVGVNYCLVGATV